jgi:hypothetical protein
MTNGKQIQPWRRPIFNEAVIAEQERVCFELRLRGMSVRDIAAYIAEHHGWPLSKSTVAVRIQAAGKDATGEQAEQVRALELERLDRLTSIVLSTMDSSVARLVDGTPVVDEDGIPIRDPAIVYAGVDRIIKLQERRAKYVHGVEQTKPLEVVVHDAQSAREALAIQELINEARMAAAPPAATEEAGTE